MLRYWFEFDITFADVAKIPPGTLIGCGITAYNHEDAIRILKERVFKNYEFPAIKRIVENVDIRELDQVHVIPNMAPPVVRGVWYPGGY